MKSQDRVRDQRGFTLPELLVAITILGIIMVAIGAMITTAFRTSSIVRATLDGSRAPKLVSTYWGPDVEGAKVSIGGSDANCATGDHASGRALVTFTWVTFDRAPVGATPPVDPDPGIAASSTWWVHQQGTRQQVVRDECLGGAFTRTATVVPAIADNEVTVTDAGGGSFEFKVSVPDASQPTKTFTFSVDGATELSTAPPAAVGP